MSSLLLMEKASEEKVILNLLDKELVVALGCTEPVAIAYVSALVKEQLKGREITGVEAFLSGNMIKNAMAVTIPGTKDCGVDFAIAMGLVAGESSRKLEVLSGVIGQDIEQAKALLNSGIISVSVADNDKKLYVEIIVRAGDHYAKVILADEHTRVVLLEADGRVIFRENTSEVAVTEEDHYSPVINLDKLWDFVTEIDVAKLVLVKQSIELNKKVALEGLKGSYGLQVGKTLLDGIKKGRLSDDIATAAMSLTAAGSDARMAGVLMPVMSNSGSGNQGLCATLPVVAIGEKLAVNAEKMIRAVALSHLVTIYIKTKFGRLSALCGAAIAGTGASCGITYLLGGDGQRVKYAIQNMLGNVTGMLCDGAKAGCAMKVSTCINAAVQSAVMALEDRCIKETDGIIEQDVEKTIENVCRLGNQGSMVADQIILDIMLNKKIV